MLMRRKIMTNRTPQDNKNLIHLDHETRTETKAMIKFLLLVNKQGQTRLSQYYESKSAQDRLLMESELIRQCLLRTDQQSSVIEYMHYKVMYRRYASLYVMVAVDDQDCNELEILEFIHALVETLDKYFDNVCELDIMFNLEKAHLLLDEMVIDGCIVETNKTGILAHLQVIEKASQSALHEPRSYFV